MPSTASRPVATKTALPATLRHFYLLPCVHPSALIMMPYQQALDAFEADILNSKPSHLIEVLPCDSEQRQAGTPSSSAQEECIVPVDLDVIKWSSGTLKVAKEAGDQGVKRRRCLGLEEALPVLPVQSTARDKHAWLAVLHFAYPAHVTEAYKVDFLSLPDEVVDAMLDVADYLHVPGGMLRRMLEALFFPSDDPGALLIVNFRNMGEDPYKMVARSLVPCSAAPWHAMPDVLFGWTEGEEGDFLIRNTIVRDASGIGASNRLWFFDKAAASSFKELASERFVRIARIAARAGDKKLLSAVADGLFPWTIFDADIFSKMPQMPMAFCQLYGAVARAYGQLNVVKGGSGAENVFCDKPGMMCICPMTVAQQQHLLDTIVEHRVVAVKQEGRDIVLEFVEQDD